VGSQPQASFVPASRIAFPAPAVEATPAREPERLNVAAPAEKHGIGRSIARLFLFILVVGLIGGAFYAGARFKERLPFLAALDPKVEPPAAIVTPTPIEEPFLKFERARRAVDKDPQEWLKNDMSQELLNQHIHTALESTNSEFLYLYGRASLLTGNTDEAIKAFEAAIARADLSTSPAEATIKKEAALGLAAASLKSFKARNQALQHYDEITKPPVNTNSP
jgi:tetratricopeptide (TPR) repeat protein